MKNKRTEKVSFSTQVGKVTLTGISREYHFFLIGSTLIIYKKSNID